MKNFTLIYLAVIIFSGCGTDTSQEISNTFVQSTPTIEEKTDSNLSQIESQKYLETVLPLKVKNALENAEEFEILTWEDVGNRNFVEEFNLRGVEIVGTKKVKITNSEARKQLLDALYQDISAAKDSGVASCFYPHHTIKAKYKGEFIVIAVCYKCGRFLGKTSKTQFGDKFPFKPLQGETEFSGKILSNSLHQEIKSLAIFDKIVAEQNIENK